MGRPRLTARRAYADANIVLALLAGDAHPSHAASLRLWDAVEHGTLRLILTPVVVAEIAWAARSALGRSRADVSGILLDLIEVDGVEVVDRAVVRRALQLQVAAPRLDFADAYIAAQALEAGPAAVASFESDLDHVAGIERIGGV